MSRAMSRPAWGAWIETVDEDHIVFVMMALMLALGLWGIFAWLR